MQVPTTIEDLAPAPYNPREIDDAALAGLRAAMERYGDLSGITWNQRTGNLVCGHQRVRGLRELGAELIDGALQLPTGERFPVRVVDVEEVEEKGANLTANNPHIMGSFTSDVGALCSQVCEAYGDATAQALRLDALAPIDYEAPGELDEDEVPEPPAEPVTKPGDVWALGRHTLVCGDCLGIRDRGPVDCVVTSPPYNQIGTATRHGMYRNNQLKLSTGYSGYSDDMPENRYVEWMRECFAAMQDACKGTVWVNHKTRYRDGIGIHPIDIFGSAFWTEIIWSRSNSITQNARRFCPSHETILGYGKPVFWDDEQKHHFTVWTLGREDSVPSHPCPFPVEIPSRLVAATAPPGGVVADVFCGSGTTMIACEQLGRSCVGIELDPAYCDVTIERWQTLTGGKATRSAA